MEPRHEQIARIALAAGARYGLALAGGYAVSAHGMGNRPSGDVDLFTSWQHRGEFSELTAAVIAGLGLAVPRRDRPGACASRGPRGSAAPGRRGAPR